MKKLIVLATLLLNITSASANFLWTFELDTIFEDTNRSEIYDTGYIITYEYEAKKFKSCNLTLRRLEMMEDTDTGTYDRSSKTEANINFGDIEEVRVSQDPNNSWVVTISARNKTITERVIKTGRVRTQRMYFIEFAEGFQKEAIRASEILNTMKGSCD